MAAPLLTTTWFGVFLLEGDTVGEHRLFPQQASAIAERLKVIAAREVLDEERDLAKSVDAVAVSERRLLALPNATMGDAAAPRIDPDDHGFTPELLMEAAFRLAEDTVREDLSDQQLHLMQAVSHLDESHDVENLLGERLVYWYTLHAPEVVDRCKDHAELARLVAEHGAQGDVPADKGGGLAEGERLGSDIGVDEVRAMQGLAQALLAEVQARAPLERYIDETTEALAPNVCTLVGAKIAARLIHQAGGLDRLARLPASTIQTLGAEKALFRHLTEGAPPPKHGVIFQHPLIYQSHPKDRGPIARALAAKIAIAARADRFTGNDIAGPLKADFEARAKQVKRVGRMRAMARKQGHGQGRGKGSGGRPRGRKHDRQGGPGGKGGKGGSGGAGGSGSAGGPSGSDRKRPKGRRGDKGGGGDGG